MKKQSLKLLFIISLISQFSYCQIKEVELPERTVLSEIKKGDSSIKLEKVNSDVNHIYYNFSFKNINYTVLDEWKSFQINSDQDVDFLYKKIIQGLEETPQDGIIIELDNGDQLYLIFGKFYGKYVEFGLTRNNVILGKSGKFYKKDISKLFGK